MSNKSKPISIRYNVDSFQKAAYFSGKKTIQALIDFLIERYLFEKEREMAPPPIKVETVAHTPQPTATFKPALSLYDSYKQRIKHLEQEDECRNFVIELKGEPDLTVYQKNTLENLLKAKFV